MKIGNTTIHIVEDCICKPEEIPRILERIGEIGTKKDAPTKRPMES